MHARPATNYKIRSSNTLKYKNSYYKVVGKAKNIAVRMRLSHSDHDNGTAHKKRCPVIVFCIKTCFLSFHAFFVSKSSPESRQYKDAYFDRKPFYLAIFIVIAGFMGIRYPYGVIVGLLIFVCYPQYFGRFTDTYEEYKFLSKLHFLFLIFIVLR